MYGFEGANVIFDTWVHPLVMGLEEHLLQMFRDDFEFHDDAAASHLPAVARDARPDASRSMEVAQQTAPAVIEESVPSAAPQTGMPVPAVEASWTEDGERELKKIPFFVRGKAKRNTEAYAREQGLATITVETLYDAKAHFGR